MIQRPDINNFYAHIKCFPHWRILSNSNTHVLKLFWLNSNICWMQLSGKPFLLSKLTWNEEKKCCSSTKSLTYEPQHNSTAGLPNLKDFPAYKKQGQADVVESHPQHPAAQWEKLSCSLILISTSDKDNDVNYLAKPHRQNHYKCVMLNVVIFKHLLCSSWTKSY